MPCPLATFVRLFFCFLSGREFLFFLRLLQNNQLTKSIPSEIGDLVKLKELYVDLLTIIIISVSLHLLCAGDYRKICLVALSVHSSRFLEGLFILLLINGFLVLEISDVYMAAVAELIFQRIISHKAHKFLCSGSEY